MHIANKLCLALTAGLIATAVAAEETNPFIGNWSGVWPNGQHNEFNVVAVDAQGQITAHLLRRTVQRLRVLVRHRAGRHRIIHQATGTGPSLRPTRRQDAIPVHAVR